jgi:hypothetical protein
LRFLKYLEGVATPALSDACLERREVLPDAIWQGCVVVHWYHNCIADVPLTYCAFPQEHRRRIRTNNSLERLLRSHALPGWAIDPETRLSDAAAHCLHVVVHKPYLNIGLVAETSTPLREDFTGCVRNQGHGDGAAALSPRIIRATSETLAVEPALSFGHRSPCGTIP